MAKKGHILVLYLVLVSETLSPLGCGPRRPPPEDAQLPMHVLAESSGQALSPQDQVALMAEAVQQGVIPLIRSALSVMHKGYHVSLQFAAHRGSAVLHEVQHSDCPHAQAQQHTEVVHQQHWVLPWGLLTVRRLQGVLRNCRG